MTTTQVRNLLQIGLERDPLITDHSSLVTSQMSSGQLENIIDERDQVWKAISGLAQPARTFVATLAAINQIIRARLSEGPPLSAPRVQVEIVRCKLCEVFIERVAQEQKGRETDRGLAPVVSAAAGFVYSHSLPAERV